MTGRYHPERASRYSGASSTSLPDHQTSRFPRVPTNGSSGGTIRPLILCPKCGSDRLIPLTFTPALGEEWVDLPRRPVAKCANCGQRTFATRHDAKRDPEPSVE